MYVQRRTPLIESNIAIGSTSCLVCFQWWWNTPSLTLVILLIESSPPQAVRHADICHSLSIDYRTASSLEVVALGIVYLDSGGDKSVDALAIVQ